MDVSLRSWRGGHWVTRASPSGGHYSYWMPPMPRIPDAYLDSAIYLYASETDAEDGARTGGSGFLVGVPTVGLPFDRWIMYAITNRHVIENGNSVIRLRTKDNKHFITDIDERAWIFHPNGDDLAACLFNCDWQNIRYNFIRRDSFLDNEMTKNFNIGPGDAWKLIEMLDEGPIAEQRQEIIEQIRRYQQENPPAATED